MHENSSNLVLLDSNAIKKWLNDQSISINIVETLESTNDYVRDRKRDQKTTVCLAEMQTKGRGRLGKAWHSPFGQNIYFSVHYPVEKALYALSGLSLIVGLAVIDAIESFTGIKTLKIKWPNDIVFEREKISGILIDLEPEGNGHYSAIIGIGINVNMEGSNHKAIDQPWSSLQKITGQYIDRNPLCAVLINTLEAYLQRFWAVGLPDFMDEWHQKDYLYDQSIQIISGANIFSGVARGVNAQGHLLLTLPNETTRAFSSGDTHVLK